MTEVLSGYYSVVRVTRLGSRLLLLRFIGIGHLSDLFFLLLALTPLGEFVSRHAELGVGRIAVQKPLLDGGVALAKAVTLGGPNHVLQHFKDRAGSILMCSDMCRPSSVMVGVVRRRNSRFCSSEPWALT